METIPYKGKGLLPLPPDDRDFSHAQVFGSVAASDLPIEDFLVATPLEIKNQDLNYPSDFCASYAAAECAEDEDQVIMVPEYTFAAAKWLLQQAGDPNAISEFGLNLRDIANAGTKVGFLPRTSDPFGCDTPHRPVRDFIANFKNWPESLAGIANKYKRASYFSALTGPHDVFDNLRSALWLNRMSRVAIFTGAIWRYSWVVAPGGIIPTIYESNGSGHAFEIIGQKTIAGEIYIVMRSSDGPSTGDNGFYYFNRQVVNKEIGQYGAFLFNPMPKDIAQWHIDNAIPATAGNLSRITVFFKNIFNLLTCNTNGK